ncbi:MAG: response regulator transcription factor [Polyangiaceae bacterium]
MAVFPEPLDFTTGSRPRPTRVLVVEDEEGPREFLSMELHDAGFVVAQAANGEQGLEEVLEFEPDVVVLDLMLPLLNGFDVARMARVLERKENRRPMAIVAVTALSSEPLRAEALAAGCDALLAKPIRVKQVVEQVCLLAPRRARPTASESR